jgi:hypothetical protein
VKVRSGWNSDFGRVKFDVEVDEADLLRILLEIGLSVEAAASLTVKEAYKVAYCTAEILSRQALSRFDGSKAEELTAEIKALAQERNEVLAAVKGRRA